MKKFATIAVVASAIAAVTAPAVAYAQDSEEAAATVEVKRGDMLYSADGKRIGNVYRVTAEGDAQLIYRSRMITIAASTLSEVDGKLTTSLTRDEVKALR